MRRVQTMFDNGYEFRNWYIVANQQLQESFPDNWRYVADLLALTSPRCHLVKNIRFVRSMLAGDDEPRGLLPNVCRSLERYRESGKIYGKKTSCFAENLKGNYSPITLDTHMAHAFQVDQSKLFRRDIFDKIYRTIAKLGNRARLQPAHVQACIWSGALIDQGRNPQYFPIELLTSTEAK